MTQGDDVGVGPGAPLTDGDELLFRQVHPAWMDEGQPSSQAFRPTKKDQGMLSAAQGSKTTAEGAFLHHTQDLGLTSAGTWAILVGEAAGIELACLPDPLRDDPCHAFVDFRGLGRGKAEGKSHALLTFACARGRLHPAG